jgi:hypothetical protein
MEIASYLTDVYGPRLTGSRNLQEASAYAVRTLQQWDVRNARLVRWGSVGSRWTNERFVAHVVSPQAYPLIGYPRAWTAGTDGAQKGRAVLASIASQEDFAAWRGKLRGAFVFVSPVPLTASPFETPGVRLSDDALKQLANHRPGRINDSSFDAPGPDVLMRDFRQRRLRFFSDEGVAAVVEAGWGGAGRCSCRAVTRAMVRSCRGHRRSSLQPSTTAGSFERSRRVFR